MQHRYLVLAAFAPMCLIAACNDSNDTTIPSGSVATVRFINATNLSIDVANAGVVATGNGSLAFGTNSTCMSVATTGAGLVFTQAGTTTVIPGFTSNFTAGGKFTVIAFTGTSGTQFVVLNDSFTPTTGQAGLRIFNAASGSGSLVALGGGTVIGAGTGVPFGTAGSFLGVNAGSLAVTFNTGTGTPTVVNAGTLNFTAGQNFTLIIAPAAAGSTALRAFLVTDC